MTLALAAAAKNTKNAAERTCKHMKTILRKVDPCSPMQTSSPKALKSSKEAVWLLFLRKRFMVWEATVWTVKPAKAFIWQKVVLPTIL